MGERRTEKFVLHVDENISFKLQFFDILNGSNKSRSDMASNASSKEVLQ